MFQDTEEEGLKASEATSPLIVPVNKYLKYQVCASNEDGDGVHLQALQSVDARCLQLISLIKGERKPEPSEKRFSKKLILKDEVLYIRADRKH